MGLLPGRVRAGDTRSLALSKRALEGLSTESLWGGLLKDSAEERRPLGRSIMMRSMITY